MSRNSIDLCLFCCLVILSLCHAFVTSEEKTDFGGKVIINKRAPFAPWGGKRSSGKEFVHSADEKLFNSLDDSLQTADDKRAFKPWGGKRNADSKEVDSSWGHLLRPPVSTVLLLKDGDLNSGVGKTSENVLKRAFKPWGGKRAQDPENLFSFINHMAALKAKNPRAATEKRNSEITEYDDVDEKRSFKPWGGKRSYPSDTPNDWSQKRAFQPWGGKRSTGLDLNAVEQFKRAFKPWGGKRSFPYEIEMDRANKRAFKPWGGKRSQYLAGTDTEQRSFEPWNSNVNGETETDFAEQPKRAFKPWGGKRSETEGPAAVYRELLTELETRSSNALKGH